METETKIEHRERDGSITDIYLDKHQREIKTIEHRLDGVATQTTDYVYPMFATDRTPVSCVRTQLHVDGTTPLSAEALTFDPKTQTFARVKETTYDTYGRKARTKHFENGRITYTNDYTYDGDSANPSGAQQLTFVSGQETPRHVKMFKYGDRGQLIPTFHAKYGEGYAPFEEEAETNDNASLHHGAPAPAQKKAKPAGWWRLGKGR